MIFVQVEEHAGRVSGRDEVYGPLRGQRHPRQPRGVHDGGSELYAGLLF